MSVAPVLGDGLVIRRIRIAARDVVYFKGIVEAHEGLCVVFARAGGDLVIAAPQQLADATDAVLDDLALEIEVVRLGTDP